MSPSTFELTNWLGEYNRALEQIQTKSEEVVRRVHNRVWLTKQLWSIYRALRGVIHNQNSFLEEFSDVEINPADFDSSTLVESPMKIHRSITSLVACLQERGFANAALTGAAIDAIRGADLNILDFAELLEVSFDPTTRTAIEEARKAWDRNEVYPLA